jgi:hypothetical protein
MRGNERYTKPFIAKYDGKCAACDSKIVAGYRICWHPQGGVQHLDCAQGKKLGADARHALEARIAAETGRELPPLDPEAEVEDRPERKTEDRPDPKGRLEAAAELGGNPFAPLAKFFAEVNEPWRAFGFHLRRVVNEQKLYTYRAYVDGLQLTLDAEGQVWTHEGGRWELAVGQAALTPDALLGREDIGEALLA